MKKDFDYYIKAAREAENRSEGLWRGINQIIRSVLEVQRKKGKSLDEIAGMLNKIAGSCKIACANNLRIAAKQIRTRGKLVLI